MEKHENSINKINYWERKLLDLTMSNALLNTRYGMTCLALQNTASMSEYEAFLAGKQSSLCATDNNGAFRSGISDEDLQKVARNLLRSANSNLAEIGSEQLFLTFGMLHWVENPDPLHPNAERLSHIAPIILVPVHITRQRVTGVYYIHATGEEPVVNVTLIELLKQQYERDLSRLIPKQGALPDYAKVMADFAKMASTKEGWSLSDAMSVGLFSFSKFVMWNDIHSNAQQMRETPLVESLIQQRILDTQNSTSADARELDKSSRPADIALPIDADSSQVEAVVDATEGQSFLLYGPPGTGKSQTITNMITNALYHQQDVLFVAQKRAALEVVQERLSKIGLAPFCLELHSNKISKSHLIDQLSTVLETEFLGLDKDAYAAASERLYRQRRQLLSYVEKVNAVHETRSGRYSLADCLEQCAALNSGDETLTIRPDALLRANDQEIEELTRVLREMETVRSAFGDVTRYPLYGLYPRQGLREPLEQLRAHLQTMRDVLVKISLYQTGLRKYLCLPRLRRRYQLLETQLNDYALSMLSDAMPEEERLASINRWLANWSGMSQWVQWSTRYCRLVEMGFGEVAERMCRQDADSLIASTCYAIHQARALDIIENDSELAMFHGKVFNDAVRQYRELADSYQSLTADYLVSLLQLRVKETLESEEPATQEALTVIRRWMKNHGRSMSIRDLFANYGGVIRRLCPCMLMSPISVAQYMPIDAPFHMVLFDEASQIPTSEAVGSIARGQSVVIVGDPKQMPPTTFFQTQLTTDEDLEAADMESILDDCITLGMREHYLNCHYRSRHESLITFSNHYYYGDHLITFPSVDDRERHIHFHDVKGCYDYGHTRTNRIEAEAIVDEIVRRLQDEKLSQLSMGVIAFSKVQQTLIEDLLLERIGRNHTLEERAWGNDMTEPLFVKNLENVQGDERDVILFSVCYGPQDDGKISTNFGPLNKAGGERRLNVAVTRARQEMLVFSSMHSEDIDLEKSSALGVEGLKNFLYYAENGVLPVDETTAQQQAEQMSNPMAERIAEALRREGYPCDTAVGRSDLRVDVAVLDRRRPGRYLLGIVLDGRGYYRLPMMRDREIVQPKVLQGLGWNLMRVWQEDFFRQPEVVIRQIIEKIK